MFSLSFSLFPSSPYPPLPSIYQLSYHPFIIFLFLFPSSPYTPLPFIINTFSSCFYHLSLSIFLSSSLYLSIPRSPFHFLFYSILLPFLYLNPSPTHSSCFYPLSLSPPFPPVISICHLSFSLSFLLFFSLVSPPLFSSFSRCLLSHSLNFLAVSSSSYSPLSPLYLIPFTLPLSPFLYLPIPRTSPFASWSPVSSPFKMI